jgi:hypothetical protein
MFPSLRMEKMSSTRCEFNRTSSTSFEFSTLEGITPNLSHGSYFRSSAGTPLRE